MIVSSLKCNVWLNIELNLDVSFSLLPSLLTLASSAE